MLKALTPQDTRLIAVFLLWDTADPPKPGGGVSEFTAAAPVTLSSAPISASVEIAVVTWESASVLKFRKSIIDLAGTGGGGVTESGKQGRGLARAVSVPVASSCPARWKRMGGSDQLPQCAALHVSNTLARMRAKPLIQDQRITGPRACAGCQDLRNRFAQVATCGQ